MKTVNEGDVTIDSGGFWCFAGCAGTCGSFCYITYGAYSYVAMQVGIAAAYNV